MPFPSRSQLLVCCLLSFRFDYYQFINSTIHQFICFKELTLQFSPMKLARNSCKSTGSASALLTKHVGKIYQRFLGVFPKKHIKNFL
jgi:hypothetical protein